MRSMGFDIATHTGMAMVDDRDHKCALLHIPESKGFQRLHLIAKTTQSRVEAWQPELAVIEDYAFSKFGSAHQTLIEYGTVIRVVLYDLGVPWVTVLPNTLKKWTTGKGNADKDVMSYHVQQRFGFSNPSHDIVDAYALAQMGQMSMLDLLAIKGVVAGK